MYTDYMTTTQTTNSNDALDALIEYASTADIRSDPLVIDLVETLTVQIEQREAAEASRNEYARYLSDSEAMVIRLRKRAVAAEAALATAHSAIDAANARYERSAHEEPSFSVATDMFIELARVITPAAWDAAVIRAALTT